MRVIILWVPYSESDDTTHLVVPGHTNKIMHVTWSRRPTLTVTHKRDHSRCSQHQNTILDWQFMQNAKVWRNFGFILQYYLFYFSLLEIKYSWQIFMLNNDVFIITENTKRPMSSKSWCYFRRNMNLEKHRLHRQ